MCELFVYLWKKNINLQNSKHKQQKLNSFKYNLGWIWVTWKVTLGELGIGRNCSPSHVHSVVLYFHELYLLGGTMAGTYQDASLTWGRRGRCVDSDPGVLLTSHLTWCGRSRVLWRNGGRPPAGYQSWVESRTEHGTNRYSY